VLRINRTISCIGVDADISVIIVIVLGVDGPLDLRLEFNK